MVLTLDECLSFDGIIYHYYLYSYNQIITVEFALEP